MGVELLIFIVSGKTKVLLLPFINSVIFRLAILTNTTIKDMSKQTLLSQNMNWRAGSLFYGFEPIEVQQQQIQPQPSKPLACPFDLMYNNSVLHAKMVLPYVSHNPTSKSVSSVVGVGEKFTILNTVGNVEYNDRFCCTC